MRETELTQELMKRREYLEQLLLEKTEGIRNAPMLTEGKIRIQNHRGKFYYYKRMDAKDTSGKYLAKEQDAWVSATLQREYDNAVIKMLQAEIKTIDRYLAQTIPTKIAEYYYQLSDGRKRMIRPVALSDEDYIRKWANVKYEGRPFEEGAPEFYTNKGERVRSKSEVIIANLLEKYQIPYRYEYPIKVKGLGTVYPDFLTLNVRKRKEIYIEHFGLLDDEDYREKAIRKLQFYEMDNIHMGNNLLITYETQNSPLNTRLVEKKLKYMYDKME